METTNTTMLKKRNPAEKAEVKVEDKPSHGASQTENPNPLNTVNAGEKEVLSQHPDSDPTWICISGIRQFMTDYQLVKELKKQFDKKDPTYWPTVTHILKPKKKSLAFIKMADEASAIAVKALFPLKVKNRKAKARPAKFDPALLKQARTIEQVNAYIKKRQQSHKQYQPPNADFVATLTEQAVIDLMKEKICGYSSIDYATQIEMKKKTLTDHLVSIRNIAVKESSNAFHKIEWILQNGQNEQNGESTELSPNEDKTLKCCEIDQFIECDEANRVHYRNKNELTIGLSAPIYDGKCLPKVGFNVSLGEHHFHCIERGATPEDNSTCPKQAFYIADIVEQLIRGSGIGVWSRYLVGTGKNGFWRNLIIRMSQVTNEIVVTLVGRKNYFNELGDDPSEEDESFDSELYEANTKLGLDNCEKATIKKFKGKKTFEHVIKNWFAKEFSKKFSSSKHLKGFTLSGLNFLNSNQSSDSVPFVQDTEIELLAGKSKVYHEKICGNLFEVSNSSFLQINTPQMDKMYKYVGDLAKLDENTVLLDICSGIGTIGLSVGQSTKKIIGIEMVESSCENARKNAANCTTGSKYEVICAKVEDVIDKVIAENPSTRVVGILDPPRAGLHPSVIKTLRTCKGLNELVFMACDVKQSKRNILDFCLPESRKRRGPPFTPIIASGVDMFPNSPHFETIFYLKRGQALSPSSTGVTIEPKTENTELKTEN